MYTVLLALYVFICVLLILAVLMQKSKGGDIGSTLGGGSVGRDSSFGPNAPTSVMNKITTGLAACFLVLSLVLAMMSTSKTSGSLFQDYNKQPPISGQQ